MKLVKIIKQWEGTNHSLLWIFNPGGYIDFGINLWRGKYIVFSYYRILSSLDKKRFTITTNLYGCYYEKRK